MTLDELTGRHVVVLGLGIDTLAALDAVHGAGPASLVAAVDEPAAVSDDVRHRLATLEVTLVDTDALPEGTEVVVRSPGYPRYRPSLLAAEAAGARVTTPMDLWLGAYGDGCTVVAVTGTKGKSSTTTAIGDLVRAAGVDAVVAGNIGVPVWSLVPRPGAIVVLEVSSYQAVDISHPPDVGILTCLSADHLSWHGGQERYARDKLSLFGAPGDVATLLVPAHELGAVAATDHLGPVVLDVRGPRFASVRDAAAGASFTGPTVANLALAVAAAEAALGRALPDDLVIAVISTLRPLRSRHETVAVVGDVRFVDDALASNPTAAAAALDGHDEGPVAMIVGGDDREVPIDPLLAAAAARRAPLVLITLPDTGATIAAAVAAAATRCATTVLDAIDIDDAVRQAVAHLPDGGTVLFAPSAPTPPRFGTWEDRSTAFRAAIATLPT